MQKEPIVEEEGDQMSAGLKEKLAGGFSRGNTLSFFKSSNWAQVFVRSIR